MWPSQTEHQVLKYLMLYFYWWYMELFMVNPSPAPKKRNPDLLIVNPYKNGGNKMSSKKRRRNPTALATAEQVVSVKNLKTAGIATVGGLAALAAGTALVGDRVGAGKLAQAVAAVAGGVVGAVVLDQLGEKLNKPELSALVPTVALGALVIGFAEALRDPVTSAISSARSAVGLSDWGPEFKPLSGLGQTYSDEFHGGRGKPAGLQGLAALTSGPNPSSKGLPNPFTFGSNSGRLSAYEPLGDLFGTQRLGSFEAESGFGAFVPEIANPINQQIAESMKWFAENPVNSVPGQSVPEQSVPELKGMGIVDLFAPDFRPSN